MKKHRVVFPRKVDTNRVTIGNNAKFDHSELGECLSRSRKAYPEGQDYLPLTWTAEEIDAFIAELRRVFSKAADIPGSFPYLLTCVGTKSDKRILLLDVLPRYVLEEKRDVDILKSVATRLPEDECFEIRPWLLSGKSFEKDKGSITVIENLMRKTFLQ